MGRTRRDFFRASATLKRHSTRAVAAPGGLPGGELAAEGERVLALDWDSASRGVSRRVRGWVARHNPFEPEWAHGKRKPAEPGRKLSPGESRQQARDHSPVLPPPEAADAVE